MKDLIRLAKLILPPAPVIALAALWGFLTVGSNVGLMAASAYLIAAAALHPGIYELMPVIVGVRFFGISRAVFRYGERYLTHDVTLRALSRIRVTFYRYLEPLAPAVLSSYRFGDLLSRFVLDVENLQNFYLRVLAPLLISLGVFFGVSALLGWFHPAFALTFALVYLLSAILIPWISFRLLQGSAKKQNIAQTSLRSFLSDSLQGIDETAIYQMESTQEEELKRLDHKLIKEQAKSAHIKAGANSLALFASFFTLWLILFIGIMLIERGQLDPVLLPMLLMAAYTGFEPVISLTNISYYLEECLSSTRRLFAMIDSVPEVDENEGNKDLPPDYSIRIENLTFSYGPNESPVIENLSFFLKSGAKLAVMGVSGSGKSTLINLLLRFWDYHQGSILLGGKELKEYHPETLRSLLGVVTQYTHLFNGTIRENMLLAKPQATDEEIEKALENVDLLGFIKSLPQGLDTNIGEGGFKLSGGQRRRLVIARVFLKNPPILLLDEATANLDPITEKAVSESLERLMEGKTTLIITHSQKEAETIGRVLIIEKPCSC